MEKCFLSIKWIHEFPTEIGCIIPLSRQKIVFSFIIKSFFIFVFSLNWFNSMKPKEQILSLKYWTWKVNDTIFSLLLTLNEPHERNQFFLVFVFLQSSPQKNIQNSLFYSLIGYMFLWYVWELLGRSGTGARSEQMGN